MAIRPNDRRRLAQLAAPLVYARREEVNRRVELRDRLGFCILVGAMLTVEGLEVESTCIPARLREAEAELDAIPDTPELEEADAAYLARANWVEDWQPKPRYRSPPPEEESAEAEAEIERLMERYRADPRELDTATASLSDLYAWCLSRHGATYEEAAAECEKAAKDLLLALETLPDDPTEEEIERALPWWKINEFGSSG